MRTLFFLLISLGNFITVFAAPVEIQEAVANGKIDVAVMGNDNSTHYLDPLVMHASNNSGKEIEVLIPAGFVFQSEEESYQNFISTEERLLVLKPGRTETISLKAMCIESMDSAPDGETKYALASLGEEALIKLAKFVDEHNLYEPEAQFLMWDIADKAIDHELVDSFALGEDGNIAMYSNFPEAAPQLFEREPEDLYEDPLPLVEVSGSFTLNLGSTKNIHIAMFNKDELLVKELFKNPRCPAGPTNLDYSFNSLEYTEDLYLVKVIMDHEVVLEREIRMN